MENYSDANKIELEVAYKRQEESKMIWEILKSMHPENRLTHKEWLEKINKVHDLVDHLQHLAFVNGVLIRPYYGADIGVWVDLDDYMHVQNGKYVRLE